MLSVTHQSHSTFIAISLKTSIISPYLAPNFHHFSLSRSKLSSFLPISLQIFIISPYLVPNFHHFSLSRSKLSSFLPISFQTFIISPYLAPNFQIFCPELSSSRSNLFPLARSRLIPVLLSLEWGRTPGNEVNSDLQTCGGEPELTAVGSL